MARGFIPKAWRQIKVTFIPKPRKTNCTESTAYYFINLSSLILKTIEIVLDRYITDEILSFYSLHQNQFAYQAGKSTDTALHSGHTHREHSETHGDSTWSLCRYLGDLEQYLC